MLEAKLAAEQLDLWAARATDDRGVISTGWKELDSLLHRGGFAPSTFVLLGGRTGTRKTTLMVNLVVQFLRQGHAVGLVGLDEAPASYVAKLTSAMTGESHEWLEEQWGSPPVRHILKDYRKLARHFSLSKGYRPSFEDMTKWWAMANEPRVVFLDYVSLLARDKYAGAENQRVMRVVEDLQVWTNEKEVVTIALHQVGRMDEGSTRRYHGATPLTPEHLKYAGEEIADVVLGTYRPAKDPLGTMDRDVALDSLPDNMSWETKTKKVDRARRKVARFKNSTFLQVLKNRPGTRLHEEGIELANKGESMQMHVATPRVGEDMKYRPDDDEED